LVTFHTLLTGAVLMIQTAFIRSVDVGARA
jgi:hypothetical protein